jgi:hypothetical protein
MFLESSSTLLPTGLRNRATADVLQYISLNRRILVCAELEGFGGSMLTEFTTRFSRYTFNLERERVFGY